MKKYILLILVFVCHLGLDNISYASSKAKTVVIVHSYPPGEWYIGVNQGVTETLGKAGYNANIEPIVFHAHFWRQRPNKERDAEKLRILASIKDLKPDLIIVFDDEAADFLIPSLIQQSTPVIFNGVNQAQNSISWLKERKKIAGVFETQDFKQGIRALKEFSPKIRRIAILSSESQSSQIIVPQYAEAYREMEKKKEFDINLVEVSKLRYWEDWKSAIRRLNKIADAVVIVVPYDVRDANNVEVPVGVMGNWIFQNIKIATLGNTSSHTKMGMLLSVALPPANLGKQSAEQAIRIFQGQTLAAVGFENARYRELQINRGEAKRLGLSIPKDLLGIAKIFDKSGLTYGR